MFIKRLIDIVIAAITAGLLAFGLFGSGLVVCMMPQTTQLLGNNFSGWSQATYPKDTMEELAEAVRSFSVEDTGRKLLEDTVAGALKNNFPDVEEAINSGNSDATVKSDKYEPGSNIGMSNAISIYTLPSTAVDHLEDCIPIFTTSRIGIVLSLVFALGGIIILCLRFRRKLAGRIMFYVPLVVIVSILVLTCWSIIDFDSLFTTMHSAFFAQGTWVFPADSLLITLFPEAFWIGMGGVWAIVSIVASALVCVVGRFVKK